AALGQVTVFGRDGKQLATIGPPIAANSIVLSPDETRILIFSAGEGGSILDVNQQGREAVPPDVAWFGWSEDSRSVIGIAGRPGDPTRSVMRRTVGSRTTTKLADVQMSLPAFLDLSPDRKTVLGIDGVGVAAWSIGDDRAVPFLTADAGQS